MMYEDLGIDKSFFEPIASSRKLIVPLMEEYPSPRNLFDVFIGNDGSQSVDWNQIAESAGQLAGTFIANQDPSRSTLRQVCGRRPLLRRNRAEYQACVERFYRDSQGISGSNSGLTTEQFMEILRRRDTELKKPIGAAGIFGIVLGVAAVGTLIYFVSKKK